ncbi:hypothetical protein [Streptosporangium canum]|uniref:hypothetical protein n=1 Tax=Streptosporangium canum TaxID=324952 RepID=UPI0011602A8D|nr:hypothetical protein [Streptosporangium canum]
METGDPGRGRLPEHQDGPDRPRRADVVEKLTDADRRGLSALFWSHLNLYGRFELDMSKQLGLGPGPRPRFNSQMIRSA